MLMVSEEVNPDVSMLTGLRNGVISFFDQFIFILIIQLYVRKSPKSRLNVKEYFYLPKMRRNTVWFLRIFTQKKAARKRTALINISCNQIFI